MFKRIIISLIVYFALCSISYASVDSVKIFPQGAVITESANFQAGKVHFNIPDKADPDTLSVQPESELFEIRTISWDKVEKEHTEEVAELESKLNNLTYKKKQTQAKRKTIEKKIGFWESQINRDWKKSSDALEISKSFAKPLSEGYLELIDTKRDIQDLEEEIKRIKDKINELTSRADTHWEVVMQLLGPKQKKGRIKWSYFYPKAGYEPSYRLNAQPENKRIEFTWEMKVWQKTGNDWEDTKVVLATVRPDFQLDPPSLHPWIIKDRQIGAGRKSKELSKAERSYAQEDAVQATSRKPVKRTKSTYTEWELGRVNIAANKPQTIKLTQENLPAKFVHLLRPEHSKKSFVRAALDLDKSRQIPRGQAMFLMEGTLVGKSDFSFQGRETYIFFGNDPLVSCEKKLLKKQKGEQGIISGKQTHIWEWKTRVKNDHDYRINAKVEEVVPQARHEDIQVDYTLDPKPDKKDSEEHKFIWNLSLGANKEQTISTRVSVKAPDDIDLVIGR